MSQKSFKVKTGLGLDSKVSSYPEIYQAEVKKALESNPNPVFTLKDFCDKIVDAIYKTSAKDSVDTMIVTAKNQVAAQY